MLPGALCCRDRGILLGVGAPLVYGLLMLSIEDSKLVCSVGAESVSMRGGMWLRRLASEVRLEYEYCRRNVGEGGPERLDGGRRRPSSSSPDSSSVGVSW